MSVYFVYQRTPTGTPLKPIAARGNLSSAIEVAMDFAPRSALDVCVREKDSPRVRHIFRAGVYFLPATAGV